MAYSPARVIGSSAIGSRGIVTEITSASWTQIAPPTMVSTISMTGSNASDHPAGKALDFMADRAAGDQLSEYAAANMDELGISYVIYRQRINTGDGWEMQEDRGGATANHMDHVHISFD